MASNEERIKILQMISEGKISADEGAKLISALTAASSTEEEIEIEEPGHSLSNHSMNGAHGRARSVRIRVTDTFTGKKMVNIHIPMSLVNFGLRLAPKHTTNGIDMQELRTILNSGELGRLIDVYDEEEGRHVEIMVE